MPLGTQIEVSLYKVKKFIKMLAFSSGELATFPVQGSIISGSGAHRCSPFPWMERCKSRSCVMYRLTEVVVRSAVQSRGAGTVLHP